MGLSEKQKEALKNNNMESNRLTREAIHQAFYLLMERQPFEEIRITDIIRKAGVSRSAFYRNYKTKEDIIKEIIDDFMDEFLRIAKHDIRYNWTFGFGYFRRHRDEMNLILKAHMEYLILDRINEGLKVNEKAEDLLPALNYGIVFNVMMYWARCGMPFTDEEAALRMADTYRHLIKDIEPELKG